MRKGENSDVRVDSFALARSASRLAICVAHLRGSVSRVEIHLTARFISGTGRLSPATNPACIVKPVENKARRSDERRTPPGKQLAALLRLDL